MLYHPTLCHLAKITTRPYLTLSLSLRYHSLTFEQVLNALGIWESLYWHFPRATNDIRNTCVLGLVFALGLEHTVCGALKYWLILECYTYLGY